MYFRFAFTSHPYIHAVSQKTGSSRRRARGSKPSGGSTSTKSREERRRHGHKQADSAVIVYKSRVNTRENEAKLNSSGLFVPKSFIEVPSHSPMASATVDRSVFSNTLSPSARSNFFEMDDKSIALSILQNSKSRAPKNAKLGSIKEEEKGSEKLENEEKEEKKIEEGIDTYPDDLEAPSVFTSLRNLGSRFREVARNLSLSKDRKSSKGSSFSKSNNNKRQESKSGDEFDMARHVGHMADFFYKDTDLCACGGYIPS